MPNSEAFWRAVKQIEAEPELWEQIYWATQTACGTALCLAGHVVVQAGCTPVFSERSLEDAPVRDVGGQGR